MTEYLVSHNAPLIDIHFNVAVFVCELEGSAVGVAQKVTSCLEDYGSRTKSVLAKTVPETLHCMTGCA